MFQVAYIQVGNKCTVANIEKNTIWLAEIRDVNYHLFYVIVHSREFRVSYLSHLLLPLCFGCLSVGIVVRLNHDKVVGLWVNDKFPGSVLQREGHLVENSS